MNTLSPGRGLGFLLVGALAGFALVAVAPGLSVAETAPPCQRTMSSPLLNEPIPEGIVGLVNTIDLPEDGLVVADVDVTVNIAHPAPADLVLSLNETNDPRAFGRRTTLFSHQGMQAAGGGLVGTVFDDAALTPIAIANPPFTGRFIPVLPLANLNGGSGGVLQFTVQDTIAGNTGTLKSWSAAFRYARCDFDGDGVEDHVDSCRGVTARTATGCPLTSRKLTATYRHGKFRGALSSPVTGCKAGRPVSVFRKRPGPDRRVGAATTRADGSWRLGRAKKRGRYYATSARVVVPGRAECAAARSRTFRVR